MKDKWRITIEKWDKNQLAWRKKSRITLEDLVKEIKKEINRRVKP